MLAIKNEWDKKKSFVSLQSVENTKMHHGRGAQHYGDVLLALRKQRAWVDCALSVRAVVQAGEAAGLDVAIGAAKHARAVGRKVLFQWLIYHFDDSFFVCCF